ncbi:MAG: hypothetical protein NT070_07200 [Cyanobacteria bacterium]|nr:hypothetical protein [Cyanobacteriota bacterium]
MIYQTLPAWTSTQPNPESLTKRDAEALLQHYSFDLGNRPLQVLLAEWQALFSLDWIRLAVIEALYLGRYKAVSVEQILRQWVRRNQPATHFSYEFEHLVCDRFPRTLLPDTGLINNNPAISRLGWFPEHVPGWMVLAKRIQAERLEALALEALAKENLNDFDDELVTDFL